MTKILDCTLRDGLHVRDFDDECILAVLNAAENAGLQYFEAGYKMPESIQFAKIKTVIMVDTKNIQPVSKKADCVRVACYPHEIEKALEAVENFHNQGFEVFLHLMTADKFDKYDILKNWKNKNILTSIYFADSFGSFMPEDVERVYKKLENCGFDKISFHAHDNLHLAFTNTIKAIELGAYSVDATVFGIGRGGGNLSLEILLKYFGKDYHLYLDLIKKYFLNDEQKFEARVGGLENVHPLKVKQLYDGIYF